MGKHHSKESAAHSEEEERWYLQYLQNKPKAGLYCQPPRKQGIIGQPPLPAPGTL